MKNPWRAFGSAKRGFTLIELMIVVAIIGILAAIAIPKFADLIRKSNEGATKGNLGAVRSALAIYYGDNEGQYPRDNLASLTTSAKYIKEIPTAKTPDYHVAAVTVNADSTTALAITDAGGWAYLNSSGSSDWGVVWVNCTHTDTRGSIWTSY